MAVIKKKTDKSGPEKYFSTFAMRGSTRAARFRLVNSGRSVSFGNYRPDSGRKSAIIVNAFRLRVVPKLFTVTRLNELNESVPKRTEHPFPSVGALTLAPRRHYTLPVRV